MKATTRNKNLSGKGYFWEDALVMSGWNSLPVEERVFDVIDYCPANFTYGVDFKGLSLILYADEIEFIPPFIEEENAG
jgi:hypothetical protein